MSSTVLESKVWIKLGQDPSRLLHMLFKFFDDRLGMCGWFSNIFTRYVYTFQTFVYTLSKYGWYSKATYQMCVWSSNFGIHIEYVWVIFKIYLQRCVCYSKTFPTGVCSGSATGDRTQGPLVLRTSVLTTELLHHNHELRWTIPPYTSPMSVLIWISVHRITSCDVSYCWL